VRWLQRAVQQTARVISSCRGPVKPETASARACESSHVVLFLVRSVSGEQKSAQMVAFRIAAEVSENVLTNAAGDLVDQFIALCRVVTGASRAGCGHLREDASGEWRADSPAAQCTTDHIAHGIRKFTPKLPGSFGVAVPDPAGHRSQIVHRLWSS
jgi:hypothetical protein